MFRNDRRFGGLTSNQCNCDKDLTFGKKRRIVDTESPHVMDIKDSIITNFSQLYLSSKLSDITIKVDTESLCCHKSILGSQSEFFDRLFSSQMLESTQEVIELKETDPQLFRLLLKLTYFGRLDFQELEPIVVIKLFSLIQRYQFNRFEEPFLDKIRTFVNKTNVWPVFDTCIELQSTDCLSICFEYLDINCKDESMFESKDFLRISINSLKTLLIRDSLPIPEIHLFLAVKKWLDSNTVDDRQREELIVCIRFILIKYEDLISIVSNSGLLSKLKIWEILENKAMISKWDQSLVEANQNRALFIHNTDLCSPDFNFEVISGRIGDLEAKATPESEEGVISAKFGFPLNINYIDMKMSDIRGDRFSYKIQYSVEGLFWNTLYDYSNYITANTQTLCFEPIVAQLFRISGTHQIRMDANNKSQFKAIESFQCFYNKRQIKVERIDGLLSNAYWINLLVKQRVYNDSNTSIHDNNSQNGKYYSRVLTSNKPIIVALDQPVMIDSFQFLLWDRDLRAYSYIVEMKDGNDWIKLADKSYEECRSMQTITFTRRPVSLVRVKGVKIYNVDCNEFRIIKFNFPQSC